MNRRSDGFSLVEIAVVLVIIGLLLGGILKGQEMINSAKVRNLADMNSGVSAAYFGFIDRFRRVPGDWNSAEASEGIGVVINGGGDNNGRIDNDPGGEPFREPNALWEHVAAAGFIEGSFSGDPGEPTINNNNTPLNAFNHVVILGRTRDYIGVGGVQSVRLNLVMGRGVPVDITRELDVKLDDGVPDTGVLRLAIDDGAGSVFGGLGESQIECENNGTYDIAFDAQDCNPVFLY